MSENKKVNTEKQSTQSRFKGRVVGGVGTSTLVVEIVRYETHAKYRKKYRVTKRYAVHNPTEKFSIGDTVEFVLCKPISKRKKFIVV